MSSTLNDPLHHFHKSGGFINQEIVTHAYNSYLILKLLIGTGLLLKENKTQHLLELNNNNTTRKSKTAEQYYSYIQYFTLY